LVAGYDEKMPHMGWEDWDYWMRVALRGWNFLHIDEIAFDYRVSGGSMNNETKRHISELTAYIFNKPGNSVLKALRNQSLESEGLCRIQKSWDYRVGHSIISPLRSMKRLLFNSRH
jgi:hypothetical protein